MPIYEYYCQDNHTIYQFYAKTLAQGKGVPKCPDNPKFKLRKLVSAFAVTTGGKSDEPAPPLALLALAFEGCIVVSPPPTTGTAVTASTGSAYAAERDDHNEQTEDGRDVDKNFLNHGS